MKSSILTFILMAMMALNSVAQSVQHTPHFEATWESLSSHKAAPQWFRDTKFGIYFHWGVYSVPAFNNEWYPRHMYAPNLEEQGKELWGKEVFAHHKKTYGSPLEFGYPDFVPMFTAENFDAREWAALFKKAGAQYAGPVAEHHDGFAMWDSELTPWNAADKGPMRDIVEELAEAIRGQGMKFVTSFHHARNNLWKPEGKDWTGHYSYLKQNFPSLLEDSVRTIMYGYMPRKKFLEMWDGKLHEVIDRYQPDLMWFDSWLDEIPDSVQTDYLAYYFNKAQEWDKNVVVTNKQEDLPADVAVKDYEKGRAAEIQEQPFLTDDTISKGSWSYTKGLDIKSTTKVLHSLIDIVSKNGQLLLNISPKADGSIPDNQRRVLLEIGDWLAINGEAVYGTRPWMVYGEGPTQLKKGEFGGVTDAGEFTPKDIRYTKRGDIVYAIVLGWPGADQDIKLNSFSTDSKKLESISQVSMLGSHQEIQWKQRAEYLNIQTPAKVPDEKAIVFRIRTK